MTECPMPHMPVRDYCPACGWRASEKAAKAPEEEPKEGQVEGTQIKPDDDASGGAPATTLVGAQGDGISKTHGESTQVNEEDGITVLSNPRADVKVVEEDAILKGQKKAPTGKRGKKGK